MKPTKLSLSIEAPIEKVFAVIADVEGFLEVVPEIVKVEFLSEQRSGVGTRFRETRMMGKREGATVLELTECVENDHVRFVSDAGGTIWDTVFTVRNVSEGVVELTLVMEVRAYKLLSKLLNPLVMPMVRKAMAKDMEAIKNFCEGDSSN